MTIHVEKLSNEPIIISTFNEPFRAQKDIPDMFEQINAMRAEIEETCYCSIVDASTIEYDFSDLVLILGQTRDSFKNSSDDKKPILAVVGNSDLLDMASKAMMQTQYGKVSMPVFATRDEALIYMRAMLIARAA